MEAGAYRTSLCPGAPSYPDVLSLPAYLYTGETIAYTCACCFEWVCEGLVRTWLPEVGSCPSLILCPTWSSKTPQEPSWGQRQPWHTGPPVIRSAWIGDWHSSNALGKMCGQAEPAQRLGYICPEVEGQSLCGPV